MQAAEQIKEFFVGIDVSKSTLDVDAYPTFDTIAMPELARVSSKKLYLEYKPAGSGPLIPVPNKTVIVVSLLVHTSSIRFDSFN